MEETKDRVIRELTEVRRNIIEIAASVPKGKQDEVFLGSWSLKDLIAHLIGWDITNLDAVKETRQSRMPDCLNCWTPDWTTYNAKLVGQYKHENMAEMFDKVNLSHHELIEFLKTTPQEDFDKDFGVRSPRGWQVTIARYLQGEIDDEREHYHQIKRWLG